jgi:hypothetical protein
MNRRAFLKSLLAIGGSVALPLGAIETAPEEVINLAWSQTLDKPFIFYVRDEYPYTLTTASHYNAEMQEMLTAYEESDGGLGPMDGSTGQGEAMRFFYLSDHCDDLDIRIVEGVGPGSDYFGAELCSDIDVANEIAESLWLPI